MLNNLASLDGDSALRRRLQYHTKPALLCIDEVGYLSYSTGMRIYYLKLFSGDIEKKSTLVTTNKPFSEWAEIFPNASCVVSLVDRSVHHSEIISIEAGSFRLKEATEKLYNGNVHVLNVKTNPLINLLLKYFHTPLRHHYAGLLNC